MDFIFNNLEIVIFLAIAVASWLKKRSDMTQQAEEERRAREEMASGDLPFDPPEAWQVPDAQADAGPPPPPVPTRQPLPTPPIPETPHTLEASARQHREVLDRQQRMEQRLAELQRVKEETRQAAQGARAKRLQVANAGRPRDIPADKGGTIRSILRSPARSKRAIALREILGPPVALR